MLWPELLPPLLLPPLLRLPFPPLLPLPPFPFLLRLLLSSSRASKFDPCWPLLLLEFDPLPWLPLFCEYLVTRRVDCPWPDCPWPPLPELKFEFCEENVFVELLLLLLPLDDCIDEPRFEEPPDWPPELLWPLFPLL